MFIDVLTSVLIILATALVLTAWDARRQGNDKRDVAFLATLSGMFGVGSAVTALL